MKAKKKVNSYVKIVLWMAFGAVIGMGMSLGALGAEEGIKAMMAKASLWIAEHTFIIMCVLAAICLLTTLVCYTKGENIVKRLEEDVDDELEEKLDEKYDFWQTIGITVSSGMFCVTMTVFSFSFQLDSKAAAMNLMYTIFPFMGCILIAAIYQVAIIKQIRRKDPSKNGDASDMNFEKVWMKSCDEGEKRIIYQASYQAYRVMKTVLMVALLFAMSCHLFFGTGMTAVVIMGVCNLTSLVVYTVYTYKIQKNPLDA